MSENESHELVRPGDSSVIARRGFGTQEIEMRRETAATALAEHVKATVQAKFIMALQRPRRPEEAWAKLVKECERFGFAEAGMYRLKKGKRQNEQGAWVDNWIEGLSIGFARSAMQAWGNIEVAEMVTYEDEDKVIVSVAVLDLESNTGQTRAVVISRSIERSSGDGRDVLGTRQNSYGKTVYIVRPTDDEMEVKKAAMVSKVRRTLILDLLPSDLKDDCMWTIRTTLEKGDKRDPEGDKKKMLIAYARIGISVQDIEQYIGHDIGQIAQGEVTELRTIYRAVHDGDTTWAAALEERLAERAPASKDSTDSSGRAALAEKAAKARASKQREDDGKPKDVPS